MKEKKRRDNETSSEGGEQKVDVAQEGSGVDNDDEERQEELEEEEAGRAGLYGMLLQLCSELHKHLRPKVFHGTDMDTLCEVPCFLLYSCGTLGRYPDSKVGVLPL